MKRKVSILTVLSLALMTTACKPDHLQRFDGLAASATFTPTSRLVFQLRDARGHGFYLRSRTVAVKFEINAMSVSKMYVTDAEGHTAKFELPKSILNQEGQTIQLPANATGQPIDLTARETARVLKQWKSYRHTSDPIYISMPMTNADGSTTYTQTLVGFDDNYYEDTNGTVERGLLIDTYYTGASKRQYPAELKLGALSMVLRTANETLRSRSISLNEYRAHGGR